MGKKPDSRPYKKTGQENSNAQKPDTKTKNRPARPMARAGRQAKSATDHYIYGMHAVRAALKNPRRRKSALFATSNAIERLGMTSPGAGPDVPVNILQPRELDQMIGTKAVHQGVMLRVMPLPRLELKDLEDFRLLVILDQISDPHNVGAILRTACAFGASAVITTTRHAPQETGVMAKAASGALDMMPMVEVGNLGEAIKTLKKQAVWCMGLDSDADTPLNKADKQHNMALVLGAEGKGLRQKTRQLCDQVCRLDMPGQIKSLNVSNAAAIAMFALSMP